MGYWLADWTKTLPRQHQHRVCMDQIAHVYGALDNFETILADLMTCPLGSPAEALGPTRPLLLQSVKEAIHDYFDVIRSMPAPLYDELARVLRFGDVVITFNYDLGVERALCMSGMWDVKTGYGFPIENVPQSSAVKVLKLHGSTNWRALLFGGRTGSFVGNGNSLGYRPVLYFHQDLEYLGYRDFVDPLCARLATAASLPTMIMPAIPKRFCFATSDGEEWRDFWDDLWWRAECAIENADELAIIGYSLPIADERARAMLLGGANKSIRLSICCGKTTPNLEQSFRDHRFSCIEAVTPPTFEGFLAHVTAQGCTDLAGKGPAIRRCRSRSKYVRRGEKGTEEDEKLLTRMGFEIAKDCSGDVYYVAPEGCILHLYSEYAWDCDAAPAHCRSLEDYSIWLEQKRRLCR